MAGYISPHPKPSFGRRRLIPFIAAVLALLFFGAGAVLAAQRPKILILSSYHVGETWSDQEIAGILGGLDRAFPGVTPSVEFLDAKRQPAKADRDHSEEYISQKYVDETLDLVFALDNPAFEFVLDQTEGLFRGVPIVFAGVNPFDREILVGKGGITGVFEEKDISGTIELALKLHPRVRNILAVHDYTDSGLANRRELEKVAHRFKDRALISYTPNLPMAGLQTQLRHLPEETAVLILSFVSDAEGEVYSRAESTRLIASAAAPAPVYGLQDTMLGSGIVGGYLLSGRQHGAQAAEMAVRILKGTPVSELPLEHSWSSLKLDFDKLKEFNINAAAIPENAEMANSRPSLVEENQELFVGILLVIGFQAWFISLLVIRGRKLRTAGAALLKSEEMYRTLVEDTDVLVCSVDRDARFTFVNPKGERLFGIPAGECLGRSIYDFIHTGDREYTRRWFHFCAKNRIPRAEIENRLTNREGESRTMLWTATFRHDAEGNVTGLDNIARDITERKAMEEELESSQTRFNQLAELAHEIIWEVDLNGLYTYVSPGVERVLGYDPAELVGKMHFYDLHPEEERETFKKGAFRVFDQGKPFTGVTNTLLTKEGKSIWVISNGIPVLNQQGEVAGYRGSDADITDKMEVEREKRVLAANLLHGQKIEAIGTLAGGIAHDFNNILSAILGFTELALEIAGEGEDPTEMLEEVLLASHRAKGLVQQILSFSRKTEHEKVPTELGRVVTEAVKLLRASIPTTVGINLEVGTALGTVLADSTQMHQVLMNLGANAGHAMREKGGTLTITLRQESLDQAALVTLPELKKGLHLILTVSDTGPGIPGELAHRIFEPFFTTKAPGEGTGLGLSVVHGIVREHKGAVTFDSTPGHGATFKVCLPCFAGAQQGLGEADDEMTRGSGRVLVVDDEAAIGRLLAKLLTRLGYQPTVAAGPLEALAIIKRDPAAFDILFTDQTMPLLTGLELAREAMQARPGLPVVLGTGHSEIAGEAEARRLGICAFVRKPYELKALSTIMSKLGTQLNGMG